MAVVEKYNTIVLYPGRFQPPCKHHVEIYKRLVQQFSKNAVYIAISNKTDANSPLNAKDKGYFLTKSMGIDSRHIIVSSKVYNPEQLFVSINKRLDDHSVIVVCGYKDAQRFKFTSDSYYRKYNSREQLESADKHGYIMFVTLDDFSMQGKYSNASEVRNALKDYKLSYEDKLKIWLKNTVGLQESDMKKFMQSMKLVSKESKSINDIYNEVLIEGGAAGHLTHIWEDASLTFGEIKEIISSVFSGEINKQELNEKIDGQNLFVTVIDGRVRFARNGSNLKDYGKEAFGLFQLKQKFDKNPMVQESFAWAAADIRGALMQLKQEDLKEIFNNGERWLNIEIVYPSLANVIIYDGSYIIFHDLRVVNQSANTTSINTSLRTKLFDLMKKVEKNTMKKFEIKDRQFVNVQPQNFKDEEKKYLSKLDKLMGEHDLNDSSTVEQYIINAWFNYLTEIESIEKAVFPDHVKGALIQRFGFGDNSLMKKSVILNTLAKHYGLLKQVTFIETNLSTINGSIIKPLKKIIIQVGVDALKSIDKLLTLSPSKAVEKIKQEIESVRASLQDVDNQSTRLKMITLLNDLSEFDLNAILPTEGVVFKYKDKYYKLTGTFGMINQLIGLLKYSR